MAMFPAFLDTCTLYGAYLCDSLLRLAEAGTYRPLWSAAVLDELERAQPGQQLAPGQVACGTEQHDNVFSGRRAASFLVM
jgi:hypothetical protein